MSSLFLSYSRSDQDFALRFAADLRKSSHVVWIDQIDIRPSDRWDRTTEKALRDSAAMLLMLSPRSVASDDVLDEISVAVDAGKPIIPIMIEMCQPPLRIARVQYIDATRDYSRALERCLAAIAAADAPLESGAMSVATVPAQARIAPALSEILALRLTPFLGPIARHLVGHEARSAMSVADLIERLALRIPQSEDRKAFLAATRDLKD